MPIRKFSIDKYLKDSSELIKSLKNFKSSIIEFAEELAKILINGKKIMFCGNGGSAADAQHLAAELLIRLRKEVKRKPLAAISLALDTSTITACGNDLSFNEIFSRPLEAIGNEGDALFAISTSGESQSVLNAIEMAKKKKIKVFSLIGKSGGLQKKYSDYSLVVPSQNTGNIQEAQICIGHIIMHLIESILIDRSYIKDYD